MQHAMEQLAVDWITQTQALAQLAPLENPRLEWMMYELVLTELAIKVRKRNANLKMKYSLKLTRREMVAIYFATRVFDRPMHYPAMGVLYDWLTLNNNKYFTQRAI